MVRPLARIRRRETPPTTEFPDGVTSTSAIPLEEVSTQLLLLLLKRDCKMKIRASWLFAAALVGAAIGFVMYRDWLDGITMSAVALALYGAFAHDAARDKSAS
jgi:hypothetical protein